MHFIKYKSSLFHDPLKIHIKICNLSILKFNGNKVTVRVNKIHLYDLSRLREQRTEKTLRVEDGNEYYKGLFSQHGMAETPMKTQ